VDHLTIPHLLILDHSTLVHSQRGSSDNTMAANKTFGNLWVDSMYAGDEVAPLLGFDECGELGGR